MKSTLLALHMYRNNLTNDKKCTTGLSLGRLHFDKYDESYLGRKQFPLKYPLDDAFNAGYEGQLVRDPERKFGELHGVITRARRGFQWYLSRNGFFTPEQESSPFPCPPSSLTPASLLWFPAMNTPMIPRNLNFQPLAILFSCSSRASSTHSFRYAHIAM